VTWLARALAIVWGLLAAAMLSAPLIALTVALLPSLGQLPDESMIFAIAGVLLGLVTARAARDLWVGNLASPHAQAISALVLLYAIYILVLGGTSASARVVLTTSLALAIQAGSTLVVTHLGGVREEESKDMESKDIHDS
jgi:hypothetical protein